jgi:YrbI family 3-deoxy-D-manno-octulosonate 8-phosphate phosphatase
MNKLEVLAVIPARGGSKGIPRKNVRPFCGYPLIAWSIAAAMQAETVTRTLVSTDDQEIAAIAAEFGAEVPFLRPAELAEDTTTDLPVFHQALQWLADHERYRPEVVVQLRPTSPIRPYRCVDDAVQVLLDHPDADSVRGLVPAGQNPHKMWRLDPQSGRMIPLLSVMGISEPYNAPRQVLPPIYWQTGHIDAIRTATILEKGSMTGTAIFPLIIDPRYTVDLDTPNDWAKAEWVVSFGGLECVSPGAPRRPMPARIKLVILDFDGVLTDNRVWTDQDGKESVASNRSDSEGLSRLRASGVEALVLSKEVNPVVASRCRKLKLPFLQGIEDKGSALENVLKEHGLSPQQVAYLGNDTNDLPCFQLVGWAVAVADAHLEVKRQADFVLMHNGGQGAVRELCDLILENSEVKK